LIYREATDQDKIAANSVVLATGYFGNVHLDQLQGTHYVAVDGDEIVGYVWAICDGKHAYLDLLSVAPAYANTGLGLRLLRHFSRYLNSNGVTDVQFNIHITNNAALRVASKFGKLSGYYILGHAATGD